MGLAVGVAYGVVQVRSPAPPLIALIGLLGMVLGEQAIDLARATFRLSPKARLSSLPAMSAGRASQAASRTRHERSIGLFLPFARSGAAGRTRAAKSQSRSIEVAFGRAIVGGHRRGTLSPSNSLVPRDPRCKRLYDLFARLYVFIARLYDFIVLLSGALCSPSLHSLPGLGARKENSSRAKISDRFDSGRRRVSSRRNAEPSEVARFRRFRVRIC
jgi:XapX domain-containing protein